MHRHTAQNWVPSAGYNNSVRTHCRGIGLLGVSCQTLRRAVAVLARAVVLAARAIILVARAVVLKARAVISGARAIILVASAVCTALELASHAC